MSEIMKLVHRIAVVIFILNLLFVFYIFTVPEYYQELYDWVYARDDNLQDRYVQTRHRMDIIKDTWGGVVENFDIFATCLRILS